MPDSVRTVGVNLSNFAAAGPMPYAHGWYVWFHSDMPLSLDAAIGKMYAALPPTGLEQFIGKDVPVLPGVALSPYAAQFQVIEAGDGQGQKAFSSCDWLLQAAACEDNARSLSLNRARYFLQRWQESVRERLGSGQGVAGCADLTFKTKFGREMCVSHVSLGPARLLCLPKGADPRCMASFCWSGERLACNDGPLRMGYR